MAERVERQATCVHGGGPAFVDGPVAHGIGPALVLGGKHQKDHEGSDREDEDRHQPDHRGARRSGQRPACRRSSQNRDGFSDRDDS